MGEKRGITKLLGNEAETNNPPYNGKAATDNLTFAAAFGEEYGFDFQENFAVVGARMMKDRDFCADDFFRDPWILKEKKGWNPCNVWPGL